MPPVKALIIIVAGLLCIYSMWPHDDPPIKRDDHEIKNVREWEDD